MCKTFDDDNIHAKARYLHVHVHVGGSAFNLLGLGLPEQAMGWLPLRFGIGSRR